MGEWGAPYCSSVARVIGAGCALLPARSPAGLPTAWAGSSSVFVPRHALVPGLPTSPRRRYWRHVGWLAWLGVLAIWRVRQLSRGCMGDGLAFPHRRLPVRRWIRLVLKERCPDGPPVCWREIKLPLGNLLGQYLQVTILLNRNAAQPSGVGVLDAEMKKPRYCGALWRGAEWCAGATHHCHEALSF